MIETFQAALPNGITLSCRASGPVGAPVLVFLHGFPEAAFVWDALLEHFGDRYRCVAPNLRGFERSSAPAEVEAYRVKHLMRDLDALVEKLGGGPLAADRAAGCLEYTGRAVLGPLTGPLIVSRLRDG